MLSFIGVALKFIILLGFLIFIHEGGHFLVAKLCKVKVNEFAIGFGPTIWNKQGKETKYALRLIPLGGFVSMEGEEEASEQEGSFSKASIPKRLAIVFAGPIVNIVFAIVVFFIVRVIVGLTSAYDLGLSIKYAGESLGAFISEAFNSLVNLFTGKTGIDQMVGPVGIGGIVASTTGFLSFVNLMAIISFSLGITNLLPIPALDGGKILLLIIEAIRRKPLSQKVEATIQIAGFVFVIGLAVLVTYNDIARLL